jgi:hypothetical protein
MKTKNQVFISSTYLDLKEERQSAVQAILKSGNIPAGMELFTANNKTQWETIKKWIKESDVYILILGGRYGTLESKSKISYTELEYDYAVQNEIPLFSIVISDEELRRRNSLDDNTLVEKDNVDKFQMFREKVLSKTSSFFSDAKDIRLAILESLPEIIKEYDIKGWIRKEDIPDTKLLSEEIIRLSRENTLLKKDKIRIEEKLNIIEQKNKSSLIEYEEIKALLEKNSIKLKDYSLFDDVKGKIDKISVLKIFKAYKEYILRGVTNAYSANATEQFLYFTICPKLQIYELVKNERVPSVFFRRYSITEKGIKFLAYIEKKEIKS